MIMQKEILGVGAAAVEPPGTTTSVEYANVIIP